MAIITGYDVSSMWDGVTEINASFMLENADDISHLMDTFREGRVEFGVERDPYKSKEKPMVRCQFCGQWGVVKTTCKYCGGAVNA